MHPSYDSDDNPGEEDRYSENAVKKHNTLHMSEDIDIWDLCDICDELKEYTETVGIPILDSRETVNHLCELLRCRN